ncbi:MAG: Ig domain-containing protein [Clostridia bacterium]|nr:Ig domain-containing protein [Clostridia bacterium]
MMKISIKREQSQAGLSFAEREKFRPQVKNKLLLLLALLLTAATGAWAEEQVVYTLDGTQTASNNAYTTAGVVNQGGITWMVTGNTSMNPWRIGGKSLSGVDRSIWSENSLDETVTKVTLEFGTASSITVNSITMTVAGDAEFSDVIDTKAVTFSAYNTVDVTPTEGKEWKNAYYRFVFNVTVSGSSNKYFQLKSIKFYNDPDAQQQGGSTEPVAGTFTVSLKEGTKDAKNWSIASGEKSAKGDAADGLTGLKEKDAVTLTYNGRLKVKGVKATSDAAPAAVPVTAITLNKTETSIKVGATETLSVTSVLPEEATDKTYTWKTSDETKATVDQDGKVTAVAAGTVTIYAEANDGSGVKGNCAVTVTPATITVTINQSDWGDGYSGRFTKDGVTVSAEAIDTEDGNLMDGGTFSTTLGNFTKIVVTTFICNASGTGWSGSGSSMTWAGTPASTVSFSGEFMGMGMTQTTIVCTIEPTN